MALPKKATRAQKDAADALALSPEEQAQHWKAHSGASPRLLDTHRRLDALIRARFPGALDVFDYNMRGWAIQRPIRIDSWRGTIDPNWIRFYVAERKQGITIHVWDPYDPASIQEAGLDAAGFKPMVGCLQYNRKGDVPVEGLVPLLDRIAQRLQQEIDAEGGAA